jgi:hypothetical protein
LIWRSTRICVLRLGRYACFRRGPSYCVIEKAKDFRMRVLLQRFDQLAAPQNFQELRWRCAGREE